MRPLCSQHYGGPNGLTDSIQCRNHDTNFEANLNGCGIHRQFEKRPETFTVQLIEALKTIRSRGRDGNVWHCELLCGFTPLHLQTFLTAELLQRYDSGPVDVSIGLFGDLSGNLDRAIERQASNNAPNIAAIIIEWPDLDPRLGYRSTGGWRLDRIPDVIDCARLRLSQLTSRIERLIRKTSVAIVLPTLPLPPLFQNPLGMADLAELSLRQIVAEFAAQIAARPGVRIVSPQQLDLTSPPGQRFDATSELRTGFPYTPTYAATLAAAIAEQLRPATPLKGIITDLDNTFWSGIVGDDGSDAVSWDLDHKSQQHGLYQELLASLADLGVLIGVASKNDSDVATAALQRSDLVFPFDKLFPVEANWGAKSQSVGRILQTWNIGADAVVFIDDNPMEIAEVAEAFPQMHCRQFPSGNTAAVVDLLRELRSLFGKASVSEEDRLRLGSLRSAAAIPSIETDSDADTFLAKADARIDLEWNRPDERCFQLVNKTNQFNLNGRRLEESEWRRLARDSRTVTLAVNYRDKFAPLGKVAVVIGRKSENATLEIDHWVMSCRAFSRRIEHATVRALFERTGCVRLRFRFAETDRNGPLKRCLKELCGISPVSGPLELSRSTFNTNCPDIFAEVSHNDSLRDSRAA
jgi:FkbH-like protein